MIESLNLLLEVKGVRKGKSFFNKLVKAIYKNSNKSDLLKTSLSKRNPLNKTVKGVRLFFLSIFTNTLLALLVLRYGKSEEENITQSNIDKQLFRRQYYPTLVASLLFLGFMTTTIVLFGLTQLGLYNQTKEVAKALTTITVNSVLDDADAFTTDGVCDITGSTGNGPCTLRAAIQEANNSEDAVDVAFNIKDQVSTVDTSTSVDATSGQNQSKAFFDNVNNLYWSFYYNGTAIEYGYSADEKNWTTVSTLLYNTSSFSLFFKDIESTPYIFLVTECNSYDICIRRGEIGPTSIAFDSEQTVYDGVSEDEYYSDPVISLSSNNHIWVASRENKLNDLENPFNNAIVSRSTNIASGDLSLWTTSRDLVLSSGNSGDLALVPQTGDEMVLISGNNSNNISSWKYDGSDWTETGGDYDFFNIEHGSINGMVRAIVTDGDSVYLGGYFTTAPTNTDYKVNYIVGYDTITDTFFPLGNGSTKGLSSVVNSLSLQANTLYVGGHFTMAYASPDNIDVNYLTKIDISDPDASFEEIGNGTEDGVNGTVYATTILGDYLYVGGSFSTAYASPSDIVVNNVTRIDISSPSSSFEPLGNASTKGVDGDVYTLTALGNYLYLGGWFTIAYASPSDLTVNRITRIDVSSLGNSFETLGNGTTKGVSSGVYAVAIEGDYLYLGGEFFTAYASPSDISVRNIARIDITSAGNTFEGLGNSANKGLNGYVNSLSVSAGFLYVGGSFDFAFASPSNVYLYKIARFDTSSALNKFEALGNSSVKGVSATVYSMGFIGNDLYFGGYFTEVNALPKNIAVNRLAKIDTTSASNTFERVGALFIKGVGGGFDETEINALLVHDNYLYIGGDFSIVYDYPTDITVNNITRVNLSNPSEGFEAFGNGSTKGLSSSSAGVTSLAISGDYLYIAGSFTTAYAAPDDITVNNITRINITSPSNSFEALGNGAVKGVSARVNALAVSGDYLYLGGEFYTAYASPSELTVNKIARFNTTSASNSFEGLGNAATKGIQTFSVAALVVSGDYLYIGGNFNTVFASPSNLTVNYITRINTSSASNTFEALGNGTEKGLGDGTIGEGVTSLATDGDYLYIGGYFTVAQASPSSITVFNITRIDTTSASNSFEALGNKADPFKGVSGTVRSLAVSGDYLYIGGNFITARADPSDITVNRVTRINTSSATNTFEALGNGDIKGLDSVPSSIVSNGNKIYIAGDFTQAGGNPTNDMTIYAPTTDYNVGLEGSIGVASDTLGNVHLSYTKTNDLELYTKFMDVDTSTWTDQFSINSGSVTDQSLFYDSTNNKLTLFYIEDSKLYYKQATSPFEVGDWDVNGTLLDTGRINNITSSQSSLTQYPHVSYTKGIVSPFDVGYTVLGSPAVKTIYPGSQLPTITNDIITIDGSTQTGSNCSTSDLKIELNGSLVNNASGLLVDRGVGPLIIDTASTIKGLIINNFDLYGISLNNTRSSDTIICNIIGLDAESNESGNSSGILIHNSTQSIIGGNTSSESNIISGNEYNGIYTDGTGVLTILGNRIGTDIIGENPIPNSVGIKIENTLGNPSVIGGSTGTDPDISCAGSCNLISGNAQFGIEIVVNETVPTYSSLNLQTAGNFIGTNVTGDSAVPNNTGLAVTCADNLTIGGGSYNDRNLISGNTTDGIRISATSCDVSDIAIKHNYIGVNKDQTAELGQVNNAGIAINNNVGTSVYDGFMIENNLIGGNYYGIKSEDNQDSTYQNFVVRGNTFGTDLVRNQNFQNIWNLSFSGGGVFSNFIIGGPNSTDRNYLYNSADPSVAIYIDSGEVQIDNNIITQTVDDAIRAHNIEGGAGFFRITNNELSNNSGYGISASSDLVKPNIITDNIVTGNTWGGMILGDFAYMLRNQIYANNNFQIRNTYSSVNEVFAPQLLSAEFLDNGGTGDYTNIYGSFAGEIESYYRLEFFASNTLPLVEGEAEFYLGYTDITVDTFGNYDFAINPVTLNDVLPDSPTYTISSTATLCSTGSCGDFLKTSEISNSVETTELIVTPTDTPEPSPTETPIPTDTLIPTATDTPIPTDTPLPGPTDTPVPGATDTPTPTSTTTPVPSPTLTPVPTLTNTPIPTAVPTNVPMDLPTLRPTNAIIVPSATQVAPTHTSTPTMVTFTQIPTTTPIEFIENPIPTILIITPTAISFFNDFSLEKTYDVPEESVVNHPVVKSVAKTITAKLEELTINSSPLVPIVEAPLLVAEAIKPITDNLDYYLSLRFIGENVALAGISTTNVLAYVAPALVTAISQPRILFHAFTWFWKRKKKQHWGIVLDNTTNAPVAFARIIVTKEGNTIATVTTDLQGKYGFILDKGAYQIYINHSDYLDYQKDVFVRYDAEVLAQDIELTPKLQVDFDSSIGWIYFRVKRFLKNNLFILNTVIFSIGFVYTIFAITTALTILNYAILSLYLFQILLMLVFYVFREKDWGQVLDAQTGDPLAGAIIRIFDSERQLDVAITDIQGRYSIYLEPGEYFLKVNFAGYIFPTANTTNVVVNKIGEKLFKFNVQENQKLNVKLYMQRFANTNVNRQALLSPFS